MKYKAKRSSFKWNMFDSKMERDYAQYLESRKKAGEIISYTLQPAFVLLPAFFHNHSGNIRALKYIADFEVVYKNKKKVVIDVKWLSTPVALLKRKLFLYNYPDKKLLWITKNKKRWDQYWWIDYFENEKQKRQEKKATKKKK